MNPPSVFKVSRERESVVSLLFAAVIVTNHESSEIYQLLID